MRMQSECITDNDQEREPEFHEITAEFHSSFEKVDYFLNLNLSEIDKKVDAFKNSLGEYEKTKVQVSDERIDVTVTVDDFERAVFHRRLLSTMT